jgi:hypothetical protein
MPILLIILIPLGALVIYAVVFDLKRRRRGGALRDYDISSAARTARTNEDAHGVQGGLGGGPGGVPGGVGGGGVGLGT